MSASWGLYGSGLSTVRWGPFPGHLLWAPSAAECQLSRVHKLLLPRARMLPYLPFSCLQALPCLAGSGWQSTAAHSLPCQMSSCSNCSSSSRSCRRQWRTWQSGWKLSACSRSDRRHPSVSVQSSRTCPCCWMLCRCADRVDGWVGAFGSGFEGSCSFPSDLYGTHVCLECCVHGWCGHADELHSSMHAGSPCTGFCCPVTCVLHALRAVHGAKAGAN